MTKPVRNSLLALILIVLLAVLYFFARDRIHFDWVNLKLQMHALDWRLVGAAIAAIYLSNLLRAFRWKLLLGKATDVSPWRLIPAQYIGFTVVGLFGRVADLARPYLVARRTRTPVATQLAVYSIERAFDLAAAAILFSITLVFAPHDMPHHEMFVKAGRGAALLTLVIVVFALCVRFAGTTFAAMARRIGSLISQKFGDTASEKILELRDGMRTLATAAQFLGTLLWSLIIWVLIAAAYFACMRAFRGTPTLALVAIPGTMLILASSMAGSLFQLPVIGWFSQIAVLAGAMSGFLAVPLEVASACGAVVLVVTALCIVPGGLICARIEGVGLRDVAHASEEVAGEEIVAS
jgi:uncharacterized membrane protein YbhN (UPF0104 family)